MAAATASLVGRTDDLIRTADAQIAEVAAG
jgi:hypothetical protein